LEIQKILKNTGLEYRFSPDACYPKLPWMKTGVFLIKKNAAKHHMVTKIAQDLIKIRRSAKVDRSG
jgi:signal recognition particle subunit SEC65